MDENSGSLRWLAGDERLARSVAAGNTNAFAVLYERYHQDLYRYCRSIVGEEADAQDAVQSALTRSYEALTRGQRDAPLRPWLFRIAHNEAVSVLRRRRASDQAATSLAPHRALTVDRAVEREQMRSLLADLSNLPERQRGALLLRELIGLSHEETALALRTSASAVKQSIFEARTALAEFAEGRAAACADIRRQISDGDRRILRGRRLRAHLRDCTECAAFAASIVTRRQKLRALFEPLAPFTAGGDGAVGTGSHYGGGDPVGTSGLASPGAGPVGAGMAAKLAVGAALIGTAAAGTPAVLAPKSHKPPAVPAEEAAFDGFDSAALRMAPAGVTPAAGRSLDPGAPSVTAQRLHVFEASTANPTIPTSGVLLGAPAQPGQGQINSAPSSGGGSTTNSSAPHPAPKASAGQTQPAVEPAPSGGSTSGAPAPSPAPETTPSGADNGKASSGGTGKAPGSSESAPVVSHGDGQGDNGAGGSGQGAGNAGGSGVGSQGQGGPPDQLGPPPWAGGGAGPAGGGQSAASGQDRGSGQAPGNGPANGPPGLSSGGPPGRPHR